MASLVNCFSCAFNCVMSKNSNKKTYKQLMSWLSNELHFGKGHKRVKNKNDEYLKVKK